MTNNSQKSAFDSITPKEFGDMFAGREDERKATCIHCGDTWYAIHYKDGVCNSCQGKGLPGETQIIKAKSTKSKIIVAIIIVAALVITYLCT